MNPNFSPTLLSRLEDAALNASAPPQQRWIDGWLVRYCPGKAKRARSIQAVADGCLPLAERIAACDALFREAGLPLIVRVTPFTRPAGLGAELQCLGYHRKDDSRVMVCTELPAVMPALPAGLQFQRLPHAEFAEVVGALRDTPADQRAAHAERLTQSPAPYQGWVLRQTGSGLVVACGQIASEADMVGLYDVFTHPQHRGQKLAGLLCTALLVRAREQGARVAYLQVDAANAPAITVYQRMGFVDAYGYHYLSPDPDAQ
jgi:GNAT superfamily N-acetyltransferase